MVKLKLKAIMLKPELNNFATQFSENFRSVFGARFFS